MHPKRVTVWCGFWSRGLIGPVFFEKEQAEAITVNGDRYRAMFNEFLFTKIEKENIGNICFQQDGSTAEVTLDVLHPVFDVVWPPRNCYLTSLDYYLWGAVKNFFWRSHYQLQSWYRLAFYLWSAAKDFFWRSHYQPQSWYRSAFYLWGVVKDKCYADKSETIEALKDNIRKAIGEIQLLTIDNVLKNWNDRVGNCMASRGSHLNEIICHY